ncbi:MAG: hypothetical protein AAGF67_02615 [Verrucomicrobiota bacterium]
MILPETISSLLLPIGAALLAFFVGLFVARGKRPKVDETSTPPSEEKPAEEEEDPTAPIVPMVEMARSPHDRHRDLSVGKGIVKQIDFLDAMIKSAEKKGDTETGNQLILLRKEFTALLKECAIEAFEYDSDTVVSADMRSRIQIVGGSTREGERTRISETILCGFLYLHGDEDTMILRKAEVIIK